MERIRVRSLQWAVGVLFSIVGSLMLIAPHQLIYFTLPSVRDYLFAAGFVFLMAGVALLLVALLAPPRWLAVLIHLLSAILLAGLAANFWARGAWIGGLNYVLLGIGTLLSAALPRTWRRDLPPSQVDLFAILIGFSAWLTGLAMLISGFGQTQSPIYALTPESMSWFGLGFSLVGGLLGVSGTDHFLYPGSQRRAFRLSRLAPWAYLATGLIFLAFLWLATRPDRFWIAFVYHGVLGVGLIIFSGVQTYLERFPPASLRTRLAIILSLASAIPLVVTVALNSQQEEAFVRAEALERQESQSLALATGVANYIQLHQAALETLAAEPELVEMDPIEQRRRLQIYADTHPEVMAFSLFDAGGNLLATTNELPAAVSPGSRYLEQARQFDRPDVQVLASPGQDYSIFGLYFPVLDAGGDFRGLVTAELTSTRVGEFLQEQAERLEGQVLLVDEFGRAIAHPYSELFVAYRDQSSYPVSQALAADPAASGSLSYQTGESERLAGYARIPGLNWGIIVERRADEALEGVYASRDRVFGFLLIFLIGTALSGILLAGWLTAPLTALGRAVSGLAEGEATIPLPRTDFIEIQGLVAAFGQLRIRLVQRTREREQALERLKQAKQELEQRVSERTAALLRANEELAATVSQLAEAKQELENELAGRKKMEAQLAHQALVLENVHDAVIATDLELRVTAWNRGAEALYGWTAEEALGRRVAEVVPTEDYSDLFRDDALQNLEETGHYRAVVAQYRKDGQRIFVEGNTILLQNGEGRATGYVATNRDITGRKQAEEALRASEARERGRAAELEALMDAVPAVVWVARDPHCQVITGNRASYDLLRLSYGVNQSMSAPEGEAPAHYRFFQDEVELNPDQLPLQVAAAQGVELHDFQEKIVFDDGEVRYIYGNASPLLDDQGRPRGAIGAFTDITRLVQAEQAVNNYADRLARSNRDLEEFALIASHDLQEPLRKISAFGDLLRANFGASLGADGCDYVVRMQDAAVRMKVMIDDLLAYSRISVGPVSPVPIDLGQVVRQVISDLEVSLEQTGGQIQVEALPVIHADPLLMHRLFQNLIGNALKFHRSGVSPLVRVTACQLKGRLGSPSLEPDCPRAGWVSIGVEDNGIGFEEKFLERIFQPFQRLHGRGEYDGTGIGLAICRKIVERYSGALEARSTPGRGSVFTVTLPILQDEINQEQP